MSRATALTLIAALYDMLRTLPDGVRAFLHVDPALGGYKGFSPARASSVSDGSARRWPDLLSE